MIQLPCVDPEIIIPISRYSTETFKTGSWGTRRPEHREKASPCRVACPVGNNIPRALFMASQGDFDGALGAYLEETPLPGVSGRVCYYNCETNCNREQWDGAVHIKALEGAAAEYGDVVPLPLTDAGKGHPVAVVGSGPAGLSAAYHLARMGHPVTLVESEKEVGGLLRYGIPQYRLPLQVLHKDVERILGLGIQVQTETMVDANGVEELQKTHEAVFLALGASKNLSLDIPGIDCEEVMPGVEFLRKVGQEELKAVSGKVVVIGGGNVAVDAAITSLRLGAHEVELVSLEQRQEMPAHEMECEEAIKEGIVFHNGWGPIKVVTEKGHVTGVEFKKCTKVFDEKGRFNPQYEGETRLKLNAGQVIVAVGQSPDLAFLQGHHTFGSLYGRTFSVNPRTMETPIRGLFAGGDLVSGPASVVEAIASGKRAALAIHFYTLDKDSDKAEERVLMGSGTSFSIHALFHPREWDPKRVVSFENLETLFLHRCPREELPRLETGRRTQGFGETRLTINREEAARQAERCFFCGTCINCDRCYLYCPDLCVIPPGKEQKGYHADPDYCKGCAVCAAVCPRGVMTMREER